MFPVKPIAAFTASATRQVRRDIVTQLRLRKPAKFALSFSVRTFAMRYASAGTTSSSATCTPRFALIRGVYARPSRWWKRRASVLQSRGFAACAYHGKIETSERSSGQDAWMRDEAPILVGTLAFGLGINTSDVRAAIHPVAEIARTVLSGSRPGRTGRSSSRLRVVMAKEGYSAAGPFRQSDC